MLLSQLLKGLEYEIIKGSMNVAINTVQYSSKKVTSDDVFVCIEGFNADGHDYAIDAVASGATVVVCKKDLNIDSNITVVKVSDTRKALAIMALNIFGNPIKDIKLIGVTGTNGKTTSAFMIKSILEKAGHKTGLIGTIANYIGTSKIKAERTTPESLELHELFKDMKKEDVEYCVMEVSSHSLSLDRVYGIRFSQGVFTNLTQDHLDFHKTFENYYEAKLKLFKNSASSIVNIDDNYGKKVVKDIPSNSSITTYSINGEGDLVARNILNHSRGVEFDLHYKDENIHINLCIPGKYNIYNALCSAGACIREGISLDFIKLGLEAVVVPGRCEIATKEYDLGFDIIIDYAHTPDGLENILRTAREFTKGRLISVFGCGGDRDRGKRSIMGKIGSELSDIAIITSDNPRTEEPLKIIEEIISEVSKNNYIVVENRREAIKEAIKTAQKGDVIVVAGKGHEDYQILKDEIIHFDERDVISDIIKELF